VYVDQKLDKVLHHFKDQKEENSRLREALTELTTMSPNIKKGHLFLINVGHRNSQGCQ